MFFTLVAGLKYPQLATGLGAAWLVFRSLFLYGYHSCVVGNKGRGRSSGHDVKEYWLIKQTRDSESPNRSPSLKMLSCSFASLTYRIGEALMISSAFSLINSRHTLSRAQTVVNKPIFKLLCSYQQENQAWRGKERSRGNRQYSLFISSLLNLYK